MDSAAYCSTWRLLKYAGPRFADCRSRGREFDPGLAPYFHKIIFTVILLLQPIQELQAKVSAPSSGLNRLVKLAQEKVLLLVN